MAPRRQRRHILPLLPVEGGDAGRDKFRLALRTAEQVERDQRLLLLATQGTLWRSPRHQLLHPHLQSRTRALQWMDARPNMTDFVITHVCRRLWRNQQVIAFAARHSRARAIVRPR